MKIQTKAIENYILFIYIFLVLIGISILGSITSFRFDNKDFIKQIIWILGSIPFFYLFYSIDFEKIRKTFFYLLFFGLLLLIATKIPPIGVTINNANRWIKIGSISFQPSTFARIIFILYLAHFLSKNRKLIEKSNLGKFPQNFAFTTFIFLIFAGLILQEPDFSTTLILFMIWLSILFVARIKFSTILVIFLLVVISATLYLEFGDKFRKTRYITFVKYNLGMNLSKEEIDKMHQPKEGLVALSNGRLFGKGGKKGRAKMFYLPFPKTDYVFAIVGEESGFIGSTILIILYFFLILFALTLAQRADTLFATLLIAGFTFNMAYNILVNIAVVTCLIPSTGVSLPFISYGGSAFLVDSISIAVILNLSKKSRRKYGKNQFQIV